MTLTALVTSGPTHEPIDAVRFLGNRSSGKQGHAIAAALKDAGFAVTLISGPVQLDDPEGVRVFHVKTAEQMHELAMNALPVDVAVCAAAVSDWKPKHPFSGKLKKNGIDPPVLELVQNPDVLASIATHDTHRPRLVVGFAAEVDNVIAHAAEKRLRKGADWIIANDVSAGQGFDHDTNSVTLITDNAQLQWDHMSKQAIGEQLVSQIVPALAARTNVQAVEA